MKRLLLVLLCLPLVGCEHVVLAPVSHRLFVQEPITTYDSSGQITHPDVVATPPGVFAHPWHLVLTPYPYGDGTHELPSVYASDNGMNWQIEPGVVNPIVHPRPNEALSDPAIVYVPETRELWVYYRSFTNYSDGVHADSDFIWLSRSADAIHWSAPMLLFGVTSDQAISPSVVHRGADWTMWSVNYHGAARRTSSDGIHWSDPQALVLNGIMPWHLCVRWVDQLESWVMLTNVVGVDYDFYTTQLWAATSADGLVWTPSRRAWLVAGEDRRLSEIVYRSTFAVVGDSVRFWYSGAALAYPGTGNSVLRWGAVESEIWSIRDLSAQ